MAELHCVAPELIEAIWPIAEPFVARSYKHNFQRVPDELATELAQGTKLLWLACEGQRVLGAIVTMLFDTIEGRALKMLECGGDEMAAWMHLHERIEQYAKNEGCSRVLIEGRRGWARQLPDYRMIAVVLEKRI